MVNKKTKSASQQIKNLLGIQPRGLTLYCRLECVNSISNKFYEIYIGPTDSKSNGAGFDLFARYGKIGGSHQEEDKKLIAAAMPTCQREAEKLKNKKIKGDYKLVKQSII
jgi:predicted DNA-binding WGR domain protein